MKQYLKLLCFFASILPFTSHGAAGDLLLDVRDVSGPPLSIAIALGNNTVLGRNGSGVLGPLTIGTDIQAYNANTTLLGSSIDLASEVTGITPIANGGTNASTASAARTNLGLEIGVNVQAYNANTSLLGSSIDLTSEVTGITPIANGGTNASTASAARTNLGLVIGTDVQAYNANTSLLGSSIDLTSEVTGITPIANGGTNASTASAARTSLGLEIGTNVQAYDADLDDLADGSLTGSKVGTGISASNVTTGTLPAAQLPAPGTTTLGGVKRNTGAGSQFVNGIDIDGSLLYGTPAGAGDAVTSGTLAQFAATTSAQLRSVMSDETGTGALVFAGGNIGSASGSLSGNASTATALATPRNINGVAFDGTAAITVTAAAGTLTGTTLASNVVNASFEKLLNWAGGQDYRTVQIMSDGSLYNNTNIKMQSTSSVIWAYDNTDVSGNIKIQGGGSAGARGGNLYLYGSTSRGGDVITYDGGGDINTRGTGYIELGASGTRTTLHGRSASNIDLYLPLTAGTSGQYLVSDGTNMTWMTPVVVTLTSNFTTTSNTSTDSGLAFSIGASETWIVDVQITAQCSSTGGVKYRVSAPTGATVEGWVYTTTSAITTDSRQRITAINTLTGTAGHTVATTPGPDMIRFIVTTTGTSGSVAIGVASGTNAQTSTVFAGSSLVARKVP